MRLLAPTLIALLLSSPLAGQLVPKGIERPAGKLAWAELLTSGEPARAATFYENVFGWRAEIVGRSYEARVRFSLSGRPVAGISHRPAEEMGAPRARWMLFFAVSDVSAASAAAQTAGARELMPSAPSPEGGMQALLADQEGAPFGLLSAAGEVPEDFAAEPGEWVWPLLFARRPDDAAVFYARMLALEVKPEPRTPLFEGDFVLARGPRARAALMALPRDTIGRAGWLGLIRVKSLKTCLKLIVDQGGAVLKQPSDDLIGGRIAVAADPQGGIFGLVEITAATGPSAPDRTRVTLP